MATIWVTSGQREATGFCLRLDGVCEFADGDRVVLRHSVGLQSKLKQPITPRISAMSDQQPRYSQSEPPVADPPSRRRTWPIVLAVVVVVALLLGGAAAVAVSRHNAGVAEAHRIAVAKKQTAEKRAFETARKARLKREAEAKEAAEADYEACRTEIDPFLESMKTVNARLNVGITQATFSDLVGAASVAHDSLDLENIRAHTNGECLEGGATLEHALNKYISAVNIWNDCLYEDYSCDLDQIDPQLQLKWTTATTLIEKAEAKLDSADPADGGSGSTGSDQS
jgi:hypothetical protein